MTRLLKFIGKTIMSVVTAVLLIPALIGSGIAGTLSVAGWEAPTDWLEWWVDDTWYARAVDWAVDRSYEVLSTILGVVFSILVCVWLVVALVAG